MVGKISFMYINVDNTDDKIIDDAIIMEFSSINFKIIHLGKNPNVGGIALIEIILMNIFIIVDFFMNLIWFMNIMFCFLNIFIVIVINVE